MGVSQPPSGNTTKTRFNCMCCKCKNVFLVYMQMCRCIFRLCRSLPFKLFFKAGCKFLTGRVQCKLCIRVVKLGLREHRCWVTDKKMSAVIDSCFCPACWPVHVGKRTHQPVEERKRVQKWVQKMNEWVDTWIGCVKWWSCYSHSSLMLHQVSMNPSHISHPAVWIHE